MNASKSSFGINGSNSAGNSLEYDFDGPIK